MALMGRYFYAYAVIKKTDHCKVNVKVSLKFALEYKCCEARIYFYCLFAFITTDNSSPFLKSSELSQFINQLIHNNCS